MVGSVSESARTRKKNSGDVAEQEQGGAGASGEGGSNERKQGGLRGKVRV